MSPATLRQLIIGAGATMCQLELVFADEVVWDIGAASPTDLEVPLQLSVDGSLVALVAVGRRCVDRNQLHVAWIHAAGEPRT